MPAIKLLLLRSLTSITINPPAILPSPSMASLSLPLNGSPFSSYLSNRSTLAPSCGGGLGFLEAHVKKNPPTKTMENIKPNYYNPIVVVNNKRQSGVLFVLSCCSRLPYSTFQREERESGHKVEVISNSNSVVGEMGYESDDSRKRNDDVLGENGVVSSSMNEDQNKEGKEESSKLLTLPTVLTLARVVAVPVFIATFYADSWWGPAVTTSIFVVAAVTDWLDGYLARKMRQGTAFGAFLDPVADKLMVAATLVLLCSRPPENLLYEYPWLLPVPAIAIIGREITMSAVREWAASQDAKLLQAVAVNNLGKWKTATQMVALTIILATRDNSISSQGGLATCGVGLLYISAGLAVWSLIVYMRKIWKVLLR